MIYGDKPQQIGEYEDPLETSRYVYAPQITAVMQAGNLYRYTSGNPVKWSDPDGEIGVLVTLAIGAAIGALVGGTVQAIKNIKNGEKWTEGIGKALLAGAVSGAISVIPIPGVNAWVAVAITGAAGNVAGQLIAGEIKTVGDVTSALLAGAAAGIIGKGAAELLSHGVEAYFKTLTKAQQKAFLNGIMTKKRKGDHYGSEEIDPAAGQHIAGSSHAGPMCADERLCGGWHRSGKTGA